MENDRTLVTGSFVCVCVCLCIYPSWLPLRWRHTGRRLSVVHRYSDVFSLMTRLEGPLSCALTPFFSPTFHTPNGHTFPGKTTLLHRNNGDAASAEHRRALFKQYIHTVLRVGGGSMRAYVYTSMTCDCLRAG
jgi:hypothetical protein